MPIPFLRFVAQAGVRGKFHRLLNQVFAQPTACVKTGPSRPGRQFHGVSGQFVRVVDGPTRKHFILQQALDAVLCHFDDGAVQQFLDFDLLVFLVHTLDFEELVLQREIEVRVLHLDGLVHGACVERTFALEGAQAAVGFPFKIGRIDVQIDLVHAHGFCPFDGGHPAQRRRCQAALKHPLRWCEHAHSTKKCGKETSADFGIDTQHRV